MSNSLIEYIKLHRISLIQDLDELHSSDENFKFIEGQIVALTHILEVANEL
jgi:hypothetical protein